MTPLKELALHVNSASVSILRPSWSTFALEILASLDRFLLRMERRILGSYQLSDCQLTHICYIVSAYYIIHHIKYMYTYILCCCCCSVTKLQQIL